MPFYRFAPTDKFINTVVTYPSIEFVIYNGDAYYNQQATLTGNFAPQRQCDGTTAALVKHVPAGNLSLYEYNIDRPSPTPTSSIPSGLVVADHSKYVRNSGLIYPWTVKDSTRIAFRTVTNQTYNNDFVAGDIISGSYPMSASISKELFLAATPRHRPARILNASNGLTWPDDIVDTASVTHLHALKNIMSDYRYLNPHYIVSSSHQEFNRDLTASSADGGNGAIDVGLLSIPSIFYGSAIKKGSVKLQFYITGTLIGELNDTYKNGVLIQSSGTSSAYDGQIAGVVMYNEGFIVLTGSWPLSTEKQGYTGSANGPGDNPKWIHFGQSISATIASGSTEPPAFSTSPISGSLPSSSFAMYLSGTNKTQTITLLANAVKSSLNHSNNPSYLTYGTAGRSASAEDHSYKELNIKSIKNIVSSSYNDPTGSFKKTTYISKIGIYDKNRNLIAIAKVATPVKKTENRDFTFKLKLDI